jgi:hypothetical protein
VNRFRFNTHADSLQPKLTDGCGVHTQATRDRTIAELQAQTRDLERALERESKEKSRLEAEWKGRLELETREVALRGRERLLEEERARTGLALSQQRELLDARRDAGATMMTTTRKADDGGGGGGGGWEATEARIRDAADARLLAALKEYVPRADHEQALAAARAAAATEAKLRLEAAAAEAAHAAHVAAAAAADQLRTSRAEAEATVAAARDEAARAVAAVEAAAGKAAAALKEAEERRVTSLQESHAQELARVRLQTEADVAKATKTTEELRAHSALEYNSIVTHSQNAVNAAERQLQEQAQEMHALRQQLTSAAMELQRVSVELDHMRVDLDRVRTNNIKLEAEARENAADLQRGRAAVEEEARRRHAEQEAATRLRAELEKALDAFQAAERERTHWKSTAQRYATELEAEKRRLELQVRIKPWGRFLLLF